MAHVRADASIWNNRKDMKKWVRALKNIYVARRPAGMPPETPARVSRMRKIIAGLEARLAKFGGGLFDTTSRLNASTKKRQKSKKRQKPKKPKKPKKAKKPKATSPKAPTKKVRFEAPSYFII